MRIRRAQEATVLGTGFAGAAPGKAKPMRSHHIMSAYDKELQYLANAVAALGGQAERLVDRAVTALVHGDGVLARAVVAEDDILDESHREIDDRAIGLIARVKPVAGDLREIIGAIRISSELERVGDLGKNIAKRTRVVAGMSQPVRLMRGLEALSELALTQLKEVLDAYASRSVDKMAFLRDRDEQIDAKYTSLFRELLSYMMEDPRNITACTHMLFCAKNLERIGDHATNIAETVFYIVTGEQMPPERAKVDNTHQVVANPRPG